MPRARISVLSVDVEKLTEKELKEQGKSLLKDFSDNQDKIAASTDDIHADLDEESKLAEEEDDHSGEDEDVSPEEKTASHKAKWQAKKGKYQKYAMDGKVKKLEKVKERQVHKLDKAMKKGKPEVYLAYKQSKIDFTVSCLKAAMLVERLKKSGLLQ